MKFKYTYYILMLVLISSCKPVVDDFEPSSGMADFTSYVSLGNSLSAGFADAALYTSGQKYSFNNIIAGQLKSVGGNGVFNIPLMPTEDGVRIDLTPQGLYFSTKLVMGYKQDCTGKTSLSPVLAVSDPNQQQLQAELMTPVASQGPFNNVSVPGVKITHLFYPGYGMLNPYYGRFAQNPQTDKLIDEPAKVNPTFFEFWVGSNDILDYATTGGVEPVTPVDGDVGVGFKSSYFAAIQLMTSYASKGVIANVPDITSIPYFKTIPYNAIVLTEQAQVDALNTAYALYNQLMETNGLPYRINFALGPNAMVIYDPAMPLPPAYDPYKFRQIEAGELVLLSLPQDSLKCANWGTAKAVPNEFTLTKSELNVISQMTNAYNQVISQAASQFDLALVDANSLLNQVAATGIMYQGINFTATFITGNTFSTDGIHLSPQGSAMVANYFIEAINEKYNSIIPLVTVTDYPPITLP